MGRPVGAIRSDKGKDMKIAGCVGCKYFESDPSAIEAAFPGISSLGSAYSSVRADAGLCARRDIFLSPLRKCRDFEDKDADVPAPSTRQ
jgi:hypothetical protein